MKVPDGPLSPLWLETLRFVLRPTEYLEARALRYGDAFAIGKKNSSPVVYLSHPEAIKEIFTADANLFSVGRDTKMFLEPFLGEQCLLLLEGEPHLRQRRLLVPPFHGERMRAYGQLICDITEQAIDRWKIGKTFPIHSSVQEISLNVILQAVFGLHQGERFEQLRQLLVSFLNSIGSPISASLLFFPALRQDLGSWSPWGRFVRLRRQIHLLLTSEIQQRRQSIEEERTDILTLLLMAQDETGQHLTDSELRDQLLTMLVAGHETTANALSWALYWIHHIPEVLYQIKNELDSISPDADPIEVARLPYLTATCQETLRICPVVMAAPSRILNSPLQIMDYRFDRGTVLIPCIYLTHQRPDLYQQPKHFKPERFLEQQFSPYEYFPFGGNNRSCIGMAFAMFEMKLVLATILRTHNLSLAEPHLVKLVRRGLTLAPGNLKMVVKQRLVERKACLGASARKTSTINPNDIGK